MKPTNALVKPEAKAKSFSAFITAPAMSERINALVASREEGAQFITAITSAVTTNPMLQRCDHMSILNCALIGLSLKLTPSPQMGQYYMVPFDDRENGLQATFILGYKGYIQLAQRSGYYKKLNVIPIKQGELLHYDPIEEEIEIQMIEDEEVRESTPTVGYFAIFECLNGYRKTLYWSRKKMELHARRYSKSYQKDVNDGTSKTLWSTDFDSMAIKTMLRQILSKWGPLSVAMQRAVQVDNAEDFAPANFTQAEEAALPEQTAAAEPEKGKIEDIQEDFFAGVC